MTTNYELEWMWKEAAVAYFKVLTCTDKENPRTYSVRIAISGPELTPGASQM